MKINLMTWNTQLYEFGNKLFPQKNIIAGSDKLNEEIKIISEHLKKENPITILQEVPYKSNLTWKEHELFNKLKENFPDNQFEMIYNISSEKQIKMTIALAKKGFIKKNNDGINNNCCVSFKIKDIKLDLLGVHSHNAYELRTLLSEKSSFKPHIMLGDFNAGNYIRYNNDTKISMNRQNYLLLMEGYIDICQGKYTHHIYKTHIGYSSEGKIGLQQVM